MQYKKRFIAAYATIGIVLSLAISGGSLVAGYNIAPTTEVTKIVQQAQTEQDLIAAIPDKMRGNFIPGSAFSMGRKDRVPVLCQELYIAELLLCGPNDLIDPSGGAAVGLPPSTE